MVHIKKGNLLKKETKPVSTCDVNLGTQAFYGIVRIVVEVKFPANIW